MTRRRRAAPEGRSPRRRRRNRPKRLRQKEGPAPRPNPPKEPPRMECSASLAPPSPVPASHAPARPSPLWEDCTRTPSRTGIAGPPAKKEARPMPLTPHLPRTRPMVSAAASPPKPPRPCKDSRFQARRSIPSRRRRRETIRAEGPPVLPDPRLRPELPEPLRQVPSPACPSPRLP